MNAGRLKRAAVGASPARPQELHGGGAPRRPSRCSSDYPVAGLETVARFAQRAGTSGPTILRFVSRLGLKSYAEFQNALRSEVQERLQSPLARYPSLRSWGEGSKVQERVGSAHLPQYRAGGQERVDPRNMPPSRELVCDRRRAVFCLGGRFTQMLAAYFHHCLRELRPGVRLVREGSASWADYLLDVRRGDVLVVFDFPALPARRAGVCVGRGDAGRRHRARSPTSGIRPSRHWPPMSSAVRWKCRLPSTARSADWQWRKSSWPVRWSGWASTPNGGSRRLRSCAGPSIWKVRSPSVGRKPDKNGKRGGLAS